jgi:hypothetical protein
MLLRNTLLAAQPDSFDYYLITTEFRRVGWLFNGMQVAGSTLI